MVKRKMHITFILSL